MNTVPDIWSRKWQIVRADLPVAHVFAPEDKISFEKVDGHYRFVDHDGKPVKYLETAQLEEVSGTQPKFSVISHDYPIPLFSKHHTRRYRSLAHKIEGFVQGGPQLPHLAGTVTFPCHAFAYQAQESDAGYHAARNVTTPIRVYQFPDAVDDNRNLLVIYKPLHPSCASNGNGIALGYD